MIDGDRVIHYFNGFMSIDISSKQKINTEKVFLNDTLDHID